MSIELHYFNVLVATVKNKRRVEVRCCSRSDKPIFYCRIEEERNIGNFDNRRYAENRDSFRDTMILAMKLSEIGTSPLYAALNRIQENVIFSPMGVPGVGL